MSGQLGACLMREVKPETVLQGWLRGFDEHYEEARRSDLDSLIGKVLSVQSEVFFFSYFFLSFFLFF